VNGSSTRAALAISLLFFVKTACLALFVTPLWDVPDEIAHFSYAADIAAGRGFPVAGRTTIPPALVARWEPGANAGPVFNWTAMHPPGYHLAAAAALAGARRLTADFDLQVRLTRLTSCLFGAATLFLLYRVLMLAGAGGMVALAGAAGVGFIPMFSHMASGVSHDTLVAALGALAAIAWIRFLAERSYRAALLVGLVLALAGTVKATIAPVALVLAALLPARLPGSAARRALGAFGLAMLALSTSVFWVVRLGRLPTPTATGRRGHGPAEFFEVFRSQPIADHTLKNFFGLIGWTGHGFLEWFQISGIFLAVHLALVLVLTLLTLAWAARIDFDRGAGLRFDTAARWGAAAAAFLLSFGWLVSRPATSPLKIFVECLLLAAPFAFWTSIGVSSDGPEDAVFTAQVVFLGFTLVYFGNVSRSYLLTGQMRGAHGRYYFAVLGFLLLGFVLPAADLLRKWRGRDLAIAGALVILFADETAFYLLRVIPFYRRLPSTAVVGPFSP